MPQVDIAIPNYNYGKYLRTCVESILTQGIDDIRILIIDNASSDDSVRIATEISHIDARVQIVRHQTNLGLHASLNEAVDWAQSRYFLILCADDYMATRSLKSAIAYMEEFSTIDVAFGEIVLFQDGQAPNHPDTADFRWRLISCHNFMQMASKKPMKYTSFAGHAVFRTSAIKRVGHFRTSVSHACDVNMLLRVAASGDVAQTESIFGYRRDHLTNLSLAYREDFEARLRFVQEAYDDFFAHEGSTLENGQKFALRERSSMGSIAWWAALSHFARGRREESLILRQLARNLRPSTDILPPLDYLLQMDRPIKRSLEILADAFMRSSRRTSS